jgi:hypothetical protein
VVRWAALVIAAVALVFGAVACGDDDDENGSDGSGSPTAGRTVAATSAPTARPTSTAAAPTPAGPESDGADGFRQFAVRVLDPAVRARDAAFLRGRMKTQPVVCTEQDLNPQGAGGPVCESAGQRYDGFPSGAWRSEGAIIPVDGAAETFQDFFSRVAAGQSDAFGDGRPEVYATSFGDDHARTVISAIVERPPDFAGSGPLRAAISTSWAFEGGRWVMTDMIVAYVLAEDFLQPTPEGRAYYPNWERLPGHDEGD